MSRSSFESDGQDHYSSVCDFSKHLAGLDCRDPPSRATSHLELNRNSVQRGSPKESPMEESPRRALEDIDPTNYSFPNAVKECQRRRLRPDRNRTASLDLNCSSDVYGSPRVGTMTPQQKGSSAMRKSGTYASPGTPYLRQGFAQPNGWSSERVPLPSACTRRYGGVFSAHIHPGKSLPSKWEDAEKWIFSPLPMDTPTHSSLPPRRPMSKSGPVALVGSGLSPAIASRFFLPPPTPVRFSGEDAIVEASSSDAGSSHTEPCVARSVSVHGWSDLVIQAPESPDSLHSNSMDTFIAVRAEAKPDSTKDAGTMIVPAIHRRDMGTQMSPEGSSTLSSPRRRDSLSSPSLHPLALSIMELQQVGHFPKLEIRDVEVDNGVTMARRSKKYVGKMAFDIGADWQKKAVDAEASAWGVAEPAKWVSKLKREEAKITAWENLQKAKAEAEIRKLEMKLEKMRSSSMEKIMNKLRSAQRKAQDMRISVSTMQTEQVSKTAEKAASFRRAGHMSSLSGCFTCHAS